MIWKYGLVPLLLIGIWNYLKAFIDDSVNHSSSPWPELALVGTVTGGVVALTGALSGSPVWFVLFFGSLTAPAVLAILHWLFIPRET